MVRKLTRGLGALLVAALLAAPAAALEDASGAYEGKLVCKGIDDGARTKTRQDVELGLVDSGGSVQMSIGSYGVFGGFLLTDTNKPATGTLSAVDCDLSLPGLGGAALHAEAKVKPGALKASLKGTLVFMSQSGTESRICQLKVKRVSELPPLVPNCP